MIRNYLKKYGLAMAVYSRFIQVKKLALLKSAKLGSGKKCNICGNTFRLFLPYRGKGLKSYSNFIKELNIIGSDVKNFACPYCSANDRTRHLFLYFDKLDMWKMFMTTRILHIAPELGLYKRLKEINSSKYIVGDINVSKYNKDKIPELEYLDITNIQYPDNYFDIIIACHVLEHIPNYLKAIAELYRTLAPSGFGIIQVPYSSILYKNFEDPNINSDELRLKYYGEKDHYRIFGLEIYEIFEKNGFKLDIKRHKDFISDTETRRYGVNPKEDLIIISKENS